MSLSCGRPERHQVATTSDDATTTLWDPATGRERLTLIGHDDVVSGVDLSAAGRLLATASPTEPSRSTCFPSTISATRPESASLGFTA